MNKFMCYKCKKSFFAKQKSPERCLNCDTPYWKVPLLINNKGVKLVKRKNGK